MVSIMVPVETTGEAAGVKNGGGVLEHVLFKIRVRALPKDLPEVVTVDVTSLEIGQSIHLGDIPVPAGVEILGDKKVSVIAVAAPIPRLRAAASARRGFGRTEMLKEKKTRRGRGNSAGRSRRRRARKRRRTRGQGGKETGEEKVDFWLSGAGLDGLNQAADGESLSHCGFGNPGPIHPHAAQRGIHGGGKVGGALESGMVGGRKNRSALGEGGARRMPGHVASRRRRISAAKRSGAKSFIGWRPRLMVIADDADLPLGQIRLRPQGSSGGHHGLESVERRLARIATRG
jgi:hypothetical protein